MSTAPLLSVKNLSVQFRTRYGRVDAVKRISFDLHKGQALGIVGESGSGKSVTSYAILQILDRAGTISEGEIIFGGLRLDQANEQLMNELRGREVSMIFQNPRAALNPIRKVGEQIADVLLEHAQATRSTAKRKAIEMLRKVKIREPETRYHAYPFELSGGMCQRVVIAMALACKPQMLLADEPTTGLDVTTQRTIMDLIKELTQTEGLALVLITHDLGLAAEYCDNLAVMEKGEIVEQGRAEIILRSPSHPYTQRLLRATPHHAQSLKELLTDSDRETSSESERNEGDLRRVNDGLASSWNKDVKPALLDVVGLRKEFPKPRTISDMLARRANESFVAVNSLDLRIYPGESVGLVGESGCGKSTTSAMIARLLEPSSGSIWFQGRDISLLKTNHFAQTELRAMIQMVFQDPTESLNPRATAAESISDPLRRLLQVRDKEEIRSRVESLAEQVGLQLNLLERLPHQLSGGQKARVGIARALASKPRLLILDEPTAALDVSVQAIVLNLLADLRAQFNMAYLFVSHDLEVVRLLCDRVVVMQSGCIVEEGDTQTVFNQPVHDYTKTLLAAAPRFNRNQPI
ncbi:MAG TPA: ABC transporter ATP-binding protein [Burkholderiales bacterium]|nr:ABC transporter ATP-binding protein [Burkholderiales bacterium]